MLDVYVMNNLKLWKCSPVSTPKVSMHYSTDNQAREVNRDEQESSDEMQKGFLQIGQRGNGE